MINPTEKEINQSKGHSKCEGVGLAILKRMARAGLIEKITFEKDLKEMKELIITLFGRKEFQAEGRASTKVLRQEGTWYIEEQ